jgi:hypothetical protein
MRVFSLALVVAAIVSMAAVPLDAEAQRRPGRGTNFYTTTGLVAGEVEAGSVTSTTGQATVPAVAASVLVTAPLKRGISRAWIAGVRATPLVLGNGDACLVSPGMAGCQNRYFSERASLLTGGAFDVRSSVLRVMAGATVYSVEESGARLGPTLRVDLSGQRISGPTPSLFLTRTYLGSQGGDAVGITTLGAGMRWVRKR